MKKVESVEKLIAVTRISLKFEKKNCSRPIMVVFFLFIGSIFMSRILDLEKFLEKGKERQLRPHKNIHSIKKLK